MYTPAVTYGTRNQLRSPGIRKHLWVSAEGDPEENLFGNFRPAIRVGVAANAIQFPRSFVAFLELFTLPRRWPFFASWGHSST